MRALKGLVIAMALLIAIGLAVVAVTIVGRLGDGGAGSAGDGRTAAPKGPAAAEASRVFGDVRVALPPGSDIVETMVDGGRLIVRLRLENGATRMLVIDLATGKRLGALDLGSW